MSRRRIVIVGNSAAGLSALAAIRRIDQASPVTMVSEEAVPAYSRVLLPHLVSGETRDISIRTTASYRALGVETLFGVRAAAIGSATVALDSGRLLPYDSLLLATGSSAAMPDIPGIGADGVFALKCLADAQGIRRRLGQARDVLVVGGGLVCLLAIRAFLRLGLRVTVAVSSDRILSRMLDPEGSSLVQERLEAAGVAVHARADVAQIVSRDGAVRGALCTSGRELAGDLVIVAKGIRSNIDLATSGGLKTARGIVVDQYMRTSREDVYAAGDAAESKDLLVKGKLTVCGTWFEAVFQGELAGCNMAGVRRPTLGSLKMNVMEAAGLPVASIGLLEAPDGAGDALVRSRNGVYRRLVLWNDRLVGAVLVGEVSDAGVLATIIRRRIPLSRIARERLATGVRYADLMRI